MIKDFTTDYDPSTTPHVNIVARYFESKFPYFAKVIGKRFEEFGEPWLMRFEEELEMFFGVDTNELEQTVYGYGLFAMDGMKLQKKFDKSLEYERKLYEDVKDAVYLNKEYMISLYLPGIFLSHYLWPHHFRQLLWFLEEFIPLIDNDAVKTFCDVGVGTGFYSKEMLRNTNSLYGHGYDISEFALEHAKTMVGRWDLGRRYMVHRQDIISEPPPFKADCAVNVEVLEHLEDPVTFLRALRYMVNDGGYAFVTAAINAPNKDHIYLYRDLESVAVQLQEGGFEVVDSKLFAAFETEKEGETVPENGSFILRAT